MERIALDETAVGTMAIEWTSQRALSRDGEECLIANDCDERERLAFWSWMSEGPRREEQKSLDSAESCAVAAAV